MNISATRYSNQKPLRVSMSPTCSRPSRAIPPWPRRRRFRPLRWSNWISSRPAHRPRAATGISLATSPLAQTGNRSLWRITRLETPTTSQRKKEPSPKLKFRDKRSMKYRRPSAMSQGNGTSSAPSNKGKGKRRWDFGEGWQKVFNQRKTPSPQKSSKSSPTRRTTT